MLVDRKNTSKLIQSWNVVVWCCFQIDNLVMGIGYATNAQDAHFMLDSCSYIFEYFVACQTNIFSFQYKHKSSIKYVFEYIDFIFIQCPCNDCIFAYSWAMLKCSFFWFSSKNVTNRCYYNNMVLGYVCLLFFESIKIIYPTFENRGHFNRSYP